MSEQPQANDQQPKVVDQPQDHDASSADAPAAARSQEAGVLPSDGAPSVKSRVEQNAPLYFAGAVIAGFVAGWGGHVGMLAAGGQTTITNDRLKALERTDDRLKQLETESAKEKRELEEKSAKERRDLESRIADLDRVNTELNVQLTLNRPMYGYGNYVQKLVLTPPSPARLKVGTPIKVAYRHVLLQGEKADVFVTAEGSAYTSHSPSTTVSKTGFGSREVHGDRRGKITKIVVQMVRSPDPEVLHQFSVPVDYTFE